MLPCEGSKLQQVFLNILSNGAHAIAIGKETGPITLFYHSSVYRSGS